MNYQPLEFDNRDHREGYLRAVFTQHIGELAVNLLIDSGFLTAPASTKYHGNYAGGLFDHSVNVAKILYELSKSNSLNWGGDNSRPPQVIGLLHDLCKVDQYTRDENFVYSYSDEPIVKGHGMKSVIYAQSMGIRLSEEERACIIYHMGAFTDKSEWRDYTHAVNRYPNVLWTHTADMIASHIMEV